MDSKTLIKKLIKIANNQQKIIEKLAQQVQEGEIESLHGGHSPGIAAPPPVTNVRPNSTSLDFKSAILNALADPNKSNIPVGAGGLSVEGNTLFWFTRSKLPQPQLVGLQKGLLAALTKVKQSGQVPTLQQVTQVQYRPQQQSTWRVGQ